MENLRKRTEREVADSRLYSVTSFARDLLVVADNMRRALDTVTPELRESAESSVKSLIEGVELTERELLKALEKNGVRQFTPQGEKFDPNVHQAMFEIPDATVPAGSVVQVVQPGYMLGDRVLRPALVGVSKGGPKTAPASAGNDNDNTAKTSAAKKS
jgi:molecular chaperone GrpE